MAYTPTNWTDGTSPVDASNLNKLEQAVSENSDLIDEFTTNLTKSPTLSSGTNIDELRSNTSFCAYWMRGSDMSGTVPYSDYCWLLILPSGNIQVIIPYNGNNTIYFRTYTNSRWYDWRYISVTTA